MPREITVTIDGRYGLETFTMPVDEKTEADVRYLMSEETDEDVDWKMVTQVLRDAAQVGTRPKGQLTMWPVTKVEIEGGW